jgi:hypothetical protein
VITSAKFTNFRCFPKYRMDGLARVNLLVGKNNSGKTALLEGLQFLASGGDLRVLLDAAWRRNEIDSIKAGEGRRLAFQNAAPIFYGFRPEPESRVVIGSPGSTEFSVAIARVSKLTPEYTAGPEPPANGRLLAARDGTEYSSLPVFLTERGVLVRQLPLNEAEGSSRTRFVPPGSFDGDALLELLDSVTISAREASLLSAMQVLEPRLRTVHGIFGEGATMALGSRGGRVLVGVEGSNGIPPRLPLGSFGDGLRRVMALVCAATSVSGGSLFVDEVDSGIHYTAMDSIWKVLLNLATDLDIQVFATTHSWDCIAGLSRLLEAEPALEKEVAVHKVDPRRGFSIPFPGREVSKMELAEIDPR